MGHVCLAVRAGGRDTRGDSTGGGGVFGIGGVRATGHKAPGESSVNITVSSYDTTHLQENPQRLG